MDPETTLAEWRDAILTDDLETASERERAYNHWVSVMGAFPALTGDGYIIFQVDTRFHRYQVLTNPGSRWVPAALNPDGYLEDLHSCEEVSR